jgi:hypothetical protein
MGAGEVSGDVRLFPVPAERCRGLTSARGPGVLGRPPRWLLPVVSSGRKRLAINEMAGVTNS